MFRVGRREQGARRIGLYVSKFPIHEWPPDGGISRPPDREGLLVQAAYSGGAVGLHCRITLQVGPQRRRSKWRLRGHCSGCAAGQSRGRPGSGPAP